VSELIDDSVRYVLDARPRGRNIRHMEQQFQVSRQAGTAAIDRGAELLVRVLESPEPAALSELAKATGIPKSTASRLLTALERRGLVEQDGERGRLRPGPAILRAAERGLLERNLVEVAGPSLDALSDDTGETINLAVPGLAGVEHVAQVDSIHFLGAGQWVGRSVDYHCSANGKVFLAFGSAPLPDGPLAPMTDLTVTDVQRLVDELDVIRERRFAASVDELEVGLAAIAAPVHGLGGGVIAALSISGPTTRMSPERIDEIEPRLIEEAQTLSDRLSPTPEGEPIA
jgi:IclR family transcriptional regulator, acetate operon repressor